MQSTVVILYSDEPNQCDLAFSKLAHFWGIDSILLDINDYIARISSRKHSEKTNNILASGFRTLTSIYKDLDTAEKTIHYLKNNALFLLIYGISPGSDNIQALRDITSGIVKDIISHTDDENKYEVSRDNTDITKHFSGLSFGGANKEVDFGLEVAKATDGIAKLITINGKPLFLKIDEGSRSVFLLATDQIIDIDQPAKGVPDINDYFSRLIPPVMFLRHVFKDHCWHNESEHASLIIDDPPLKKTYGFLNYDSLLTEMDRHDFFSDIAFIPWNYRRTDEYIANIFRARDDRFAICVHGCDHTKSEFGTTNPQEIDRKEKLSLQRMIAHEKIYNIPFDKVMVFPQGVFSTESMMVLKSNNYLAAVNSDIIPEGSDPAIKVRDILEPAIMSYHAFPLYYRRYPGEIASFAFDLFLGKPALIVTHHDNYQKLESITGLVDMLNALSNNLEWTRLSNIVNSSYLTKSLGENEFQIRLYSPNTTIDNRADRSSAYHICKKESPETRIKQVNLDGREIPYNLNDNNLCIDVGIPPKKSINIEIVYEELYADTGLSPGTYIKLKIATRRMFSEIRDNYIAKQPLLLALYNKLRKLI